MNAKNARFLGRFDFSVIAIRETSDDACGTAENKRKEEEQKSRKYRADSTARNETNTENDDREKRRTENTYDRRTQSRAQATAAFSAAADGDRNRKNREINDCNSEHNPEKSVADNNHTRDLKKSGNNADDKTADDGKKSAVAFAITVEHILFHLHCQYMRQRKLA